MTTGQRIIKRAIIPIGGLGTRMGPIAKAVPKSMFPLVDCRGRLRPLLHHACMEASAAGIDSVAVVANPQQIDPLHRYFTAAGKESAAELPVNIDFLSQPQPRGLGDAVMLAEYYAAGEPFMMLLGDHAWVSDDRSRPSAAQVVDAYAEHRGAAMVGMQVVPAEMLPSVGAARTARQGPRLRLRGHYREAPRRGGQTAARMRGPRAGKIPRPQWNIHLLAGDIRLPPRVDPRLPPGRGGTPAYQRPAIAAAAAHAGLFPDPRGRAMHGLRQPGGIRRSLRRHPQSAMQDVRAPFGANSKSQAPNYKQVPNSETANSKRKQQRQTLL